MVKQELRDLITEKGFSESIICEDPAFDQSIIGIDHQGRTVYSFELMVEEYVSDDVEDVTKLEEPEYYDKRDEAVEFIEYNTLRAIPYWGTGGPLVVDYNPDEEKYYDLVRDEEFDPDKDLDFMIPEAMSKFKEFEY